MNAHLSGSASLHHHNDEDGLERYRSALEAADLGLFDFYPQSGKLIWSAKTRELFGLPAGDDREVSYELFLEGLHPDDRERVDAIVGLAMTPESGGHYNVEYRTIGLADGKLRWVRATGRIYFNAEGKPQRFAGTTQDITTVKQTEEQLKYRQALLEAQNEAIPDAILIVDTKGKMLSRNKQFEKLWNIPQDILDRMDDDAALQFAVTQLADPEGFMEQVSQCYTNPEISDHTEMLFKDGRVIERYGNAVLGEDGTCYGWAWYFRDITEQKRAEEELRRTAERFAIAERATNGFIFDWDIKSGKV